MTFDDFTFVVWTGFLPVWLVVELVILWRRAKRGLPTRTISMVARDRAWQLTAVVFFWCAMPIHWWVPIGWGTTPGYVAFWVLQALLLAWNITMWRRTAKPLAEWPRWLRWVNWPVWYIPAGALAAALLFPQSGVVPWSP